MDDLSRDILTRGYNPAQDAPSVAELRARVERGGALLDTIERGWHDRVDLERLDVHSTVNGVLGQVFGVRASWADVCGRLGIRWWDAYRSRPPEYGFGLWRAEGYDAADPDWRTAERNCRELAGQWYEAIIHRRKKAPDV